MPPLVHEDTLRLRIMPGSPSPSPCPPVDSLSRFVSDAGFPIAKFAAKLAVGNTLDSIGNDITRKTPASFEPSIDYIVTKIPRFTFEKFPGAEPTLTTQVTPRTAATRAPQPRTNTRHAPDGSCVTRETVKRRERTSPGRRRRDREFAVQMKSVGEAMAMGRTFKESFQKALRSMELGFEGYSIPPSIDQSAITENDLVYNLRTPNPERQIYIMKALYDGWSEERIFELTNIDPWFIRQFKEMVDIEKWLRASKLGDLTAEDFYEVKRNGFSDMQIARFLGVDQMEVRARRKVGAGVTMQVNKLNGRRVWASGLVLART